MPVEFSNHTDNEVQSVIQVIFNYIPQRPENGAHSSTPPKNDHFVDSSKVSLVLTFQEGHEESLAISFSLREDLHAKILGNTYIRLLQECISSPDRRFKDFDILNEDMHQASLEIRKGPARESRFSGTPLKRLEEVTEILPDSAAAKDDSSESITYKARFGRAGIHCTELQNYCRRRHLRISYEERVTT